MNWKINLLIGYLKHKTEDTQNYKFWSSAGTCIYPRPAFPLFSFSGAGDKYNDKNKGWTDAIVTVTVSAQLSHVAATQPLRDTTIIKNMKLQDQFTGPGLELRLLCARAEPREQQDKNSIQSHSDHTRDQGKKLPETVWKQIKTPSQGLWESQGWKVCLYFKWMDCITLNICQQDH